MLDRHETRDDYRKISVGLISMTLLCFMYVSYVINFSVLFTFYPNSYIKIFIKKIHGDNPISIALRPTIYSWQENNWEINYNIKLIFLWDIKKQNLDV